MPQNNAEATVLRLICRGLDRDTIIAYAVENNWPETPAQIDELMETAFVKLARHAAEIDLDVELGVAMIRLNRMFMDAGKVQDIKTQLQVQKEINKQLALQVRVQEMKNRPNSRNTPNERPRLKIAK